MGQAKLRGSYAERRTQAIASITERHVELAQMFGTTARRIRDLPPATLAKVEQAYLVQKEREKARAERQAQAEAQQELEAASRGAKLAGASGILVTEGSGISSLKAAALIQAAADSGVFLVQPEDVRSITG